VAQKVAQKIERRMTRVEAAAWFMAQTGLPLSPRTLENWGIPYCAVHGRAMYRYADMEQHIHDVSGSEK
jgi:hypothetical protein